MNIEEIKTDREKLNSLRGERNTLRWEIDKAVRISTSEGAIFRHKYHDTWDIIHPKTGKPFAANSHWFESFGTDEQKEMIEKRREEIEQSIHADKRQRLKETSKGIEKIYDKYDKPLSGIMVTEGYHDDGESDLADLFLFAQRILEIET